jgi:hypothetical protein
MSNKSVKKVTKSTSHSAARLDHFLPHNEPCTSLPADYEIIEVNGFQIKRRKSKSDAGNADTRATSYATPPVAKLGTAEATPQRTPNVEEYEISANLYNRLTEALHDDLTDASRLLAMCSSVCAAELDELNQAGDGRLASALEAVFSNFMDGIAAALDDESIQMAPVVDEVDCGDDFKVDVASRKLGLQRRLDILKKEEQEWSDLLAKVDSIDLSVEVVADEGASGRVNMELAADEIRGLQQLQESMQKQVITQVEGVSLIVGNIEDLIEKANTKAQDAQKNLHTRRYKEYPLVNSPKRLIKAIVRNP